MSSSPLVAGVLVASVFATASCGASSKVSRGRLSHADLIAKADAICARMRAEYHANGYTTNASIAKLAPILAGYEQTGVDEMRALRPPASLTSDWNLIVDNAQSIATDTAKLGQLAKENNLKAAASLFAIDRRNQQRALTVAARDGFKECSLAL
jgi:hypothetical protein